MTSPAAIALRSSKRSSDPRPPARPLTHLSARRRRCHRLYAPHDAPPVLHPPRHLVLLQGLHPARRQAHAHPQPLRASQADTPPPLTQGLQQGQLLLRMPRCRCACKLPAQVHVSKHLGCTCAAPASGLAHSLGRRQRHPVPPAQQRAGAAAVLQATRRLGGGQGHRRGRYNTGGPWCGCSWAPGSRRGQGRAGRCKAGARQGGAARPPPLSASCTHRHQETAS